MKDAIKKELLEYQRQYSLLKRMFADTRQSYDYLDKRYVKVKNALYALYNWQNGCPTPGKEKEWRNVMKIVRKVLGIPEDELDPQDCLHGYLMSAEGKVYCGLCNEVLEGVLPSEVPEIPKRYFICDHDWDTPSRFGNIQIRRCKECGQVNCMGMLRKEEEWYRVLPGIQI